MTLFGPRLVETLDVPTENLERLHALGAEIAEGNLIPYLGPGVIDVGPRSSVPATPEALAMELHARVAVGAKLRGNMWGTAQFIEQRRHRKTLVAIMSDVFKTPVEPGLLHNWLAGHKVPLVVDTWYDAALSSAFKAAGRTDFGEIQGVTRALETRDVWTKAYASDGREVPLEAAGSWTTIIYKPHGSAVPAANFLVADSDYVEVLTEIDIQTPIPDIVKERRTGHGFVFIGCRFDDQMLRTYARQILKRSAGPHYAIVDFEPTRMEEKFFAEMAIEPIAATLVGAIEAIVSA